MSVNAAACVSSRRGTQFIPAGERLVVEMPDGGGPDEPTRRDPTAIAFDVANGYLSREAARHIYKVVLDDEDRVDETPTAEARRAG